MIKQILKSPLRYNKKVTLISGGSKGIGAGCVKEFIKAGANVVFCARTPDIGDLLVFKKVKKVNKIGPGSARFFKCDVSNKKDLEKLVDFTVNEFGRVDCLINNAGWHPPPTSFIDTKIEEFESLLNLNLVSYFYLSKLCIPHIIKTKGNIINISSLVGHMGQSNAVAYCTTKGGIHAMTKAMAIDLAKYEVRCNSISPGNIRTPLFDDWLNGTDDASKTLTEQNNVQHLHRLGNIEECGKLALYIASDATFTTGTDFIISGGAELGYGLKF